MFDDITVTSIFDDDSVLTLWHCGRHRRSVVVPDDENILCSSSGSSSSRSMIGAAWRFDSLRSLAPAAHGCDRDCLFGSTPPLGTDDGHLATASRARGAELHLQLATRKKHHTHERSPTCNIPAILVKSFTACISWGQHRICIKQLASRDWCQCLFRTPVFVADDPAPGTKHGTAEATPAQHQQFL